MNVENDFYKKNLSKIILVTGGTKSGKSEFAEHLANNFIDLTYIALSELRPDDEIWVEKIKIHRDRRPKNWKLVETTNLINTLHLEFGPVLIDSIGGFVMESINTDIINWKEKMRTLIDLLQKRKNTSIVVGEQVGWSLVSEYEIGNRYIERIGELQKMISKISNENWLTINGRAIKIDDISLEIPY